MLLDAYASGGMPRDVLAVLDHLTPPVDDAEQSRAAEIRKLAESQAAGIQWPVEVAVNWDARTTRIVRTMPTEERIAETRIVAGKHFAGWRLVSEANSPLAMRDTLGMLRRIAVDGGVAEMDKDAQISGGAMVIVKPDGLIGIDLFGLLADQGDSLLWQRSMGGDGGPAARRRSTMTPFDDRLVRYDVSSATNTNTIPEFRLGPILGDRVLMLQGGDLLAIDLLTAETLWINSTAPSSGAVLCQGDRVAVVSPTTKEVVFFNVHDGQRLESQPWQGGEIWESTGTHVLSYRETGTPHQYDVLLTNPFDGKVLLQHQSMGANRSNNDPSIPCAYGRAIRGQFLLLLANDGNLRIWDLVQGKEISNQTLPAFADLVGVSVMEMGDSLIVLPRRKVEQDAAQETTQVQTSDGKQHVTAHGVFAVSIKDGSLQWGQAFEQPWGCSLSQPSESPLLLFSRSPFVYSTTSRRKSLDVLAMDMRDGRVVDESLNQPIAAGNNELETKVTVQPTLSRVIVQLGSQLLTYNFGPQPEK
jgi:hypothetical protein